MRDSRGGSRRIGKANSRAGGGFPLPKKQVLLTKTEANDQFAIALNISFLEVIEETTTTTNEHQQTTTAVMVIFVGFEVFGQDVDAFGQKRNLNLG